jgi:hypothetical protein
LRFEPSFFLNLRAFCVVLTLMNNYLCKFWGEEEGLLKKIWGEGGL